MVEFCRPLHSRLLLHPAVILQVRPISSMPSAAFSRWISSLGCLMQALDRKR